jgi:hypothetical protein
MRASAKRFHGKRKVTINQISQEYLKETFEYKDGSLFLISKPWIRKDIVHKRSGYSRISIHGKAYQTHQIIFLMFYGYLPEEVDHIDNNKLNNKISNLRPSTKSQNQWNRKNYSNNVTGVKGVGFHKGSFRARCQVHGKQYNIGQFKTLDEAKKAVETFRTEHHKEYARHD